METDFKLITGYGNKYYINKNGIVINKKTGRELKAYITKNGYKMITLCYNNKSKKIFLHRLLATLFLPNPFNKPFINHIDGNKLNNDINNLEWCTSHENNLHAWKNGLCENVRKKLIENGRKRDLTKLHEASKKACTGLKRSIETRKKISESHKGLGAKSIKCIETGEIFSSIQEASNKYNVCHEAIRQAVHNKTKSCGLHFIFN